MGSFAGVKPLGACNAEGYTTVLTKVKGIGKALELTAQYVKETAVDVENQVLLIAHSDRELYANTLKTKLQELLSPKEILVTDVHCACGANVGPGMVGVYYLGEKVSDELAAEKEIINKLQGK
jgi:fatty acid-binding protein DegV